MKIISNKELFFTNPKNFNDPYDCYNGLIDFQNPTTDDIKNIVNKSSSLSRSEKRKKEKDLLKNPSELNTIFTKILDNEISKFGICCFSKTHKQLLMWSHYGDYHKGLCIGFEFQPITDDYFIHEVDYRLKLVKKNHFNERNEGFRNLLLTKSIDWKYEKEVRAISLNYNGLVQISKEAIKEVYLGSRLEDDNRQLLLNRLNELNYNIDIYDLELMENDYKLKEKPIINNKNLNN